MARIHVRVSDLSEGRRHLPPPDSVSSVEIDSIDSVMVPVYVHFGHVRAGEREKQANV